MHIHKIRYMKNSYKKDRSKKDHVSLWKGYHKLYFKAYLFNIQATSAGPTHLYIAIPGRTGADDLLVSLFIPRPFLTEAIPFSILLLIVGYSLHRCNYHIIVGVQPVSGLDRIFLRLFKKLLFKWGIELHVNTPLFQDYSYVLWFIPLQGKQAGSRSLCIWHGLLQKAWS